MDNQINCQDIEKNLSAYIDDELNDNDKLFIEEHLKNCPNCQQQLNQLSQTISLCKNTLGKTTSNLSINYKELIEKSKICANIEEKLSPFLDGELSRQEIIEVTEHLMVCPHCRKEFYHLKQTCNCLKNYFEKSIQNAPAKTEIKNILSKEKYKEYAFVSIAAVCIFSLLSWFSIKTIEPQFIEKAKENVKSDLIYVNSEAFVLANSYHKSSDNLLAVIYGQN
ncbi:MAG: zf-HC2 domain-containing protein [Candidatus Gastranaerophilales bacterium]|nr:zf-HC2 domain-containing protein [Candidatus Gastranaerophilales bacterium]